MVAHLQPPLRLSVWDRVVERRREIEHHHGRAEHGDARRRLGTGVGENRKGDEKHKTGDRQHQRHPVGHGVGEFLSFAVAAERGKRRIVCGHRLPLLSVLSKRKKGANVA